MKFLLPFLALAALFLGGIFVFNVFAQTEIKPGISGISVSPGYLNQYSTQNLAINANITSVYGIQSARFSIKDPNGTIVISAPLYDDGNHNDGAANDELFGVSFNYVYTYFPGTYYVTIEATAAFTGTKAVQPDAVSFIVAPAVLPTGQVSSTCQSLQSLINNNLGKSCKLSGAFVFTADVNKDGFVNDSDASLYTQKKSEAGWCESKLYDLTDSCQGFFSRDFTGPAPGRSDIWRFISWPHQDGIFKEMVQQQCGSDAIIWSEAENYAAQMNPGKGYWFNITKPCALGKSGAPYNNFSLNLQPNQCVPFGAPFSALSLNDIAGSCDPSQLWLFEWDEGNYPVDKIRPGYGYSICNGNQNCALGQSFCQQLIKQYQNSSGVCTDSTYSPAADYNNDGKIDFNDGFVVIEAQNQGEIFCQSQLQKQNICNKPVSSTCANLGDLDNDGLITAKDEEIIRNYYPTPKINLSPESWQRADVNSDGNVNTADADLIKDFQGGKISDLPGCSLDFSGSVILPENMFINGEPTPVKIYLLKKGGLPVSIDGSKITVFDQWKGKNGEVLVEKKIREEGISFGPGWQSKEITFDWTPDGIGIHDLKLLIEYFQYPGDPPEINKENNHYVLSAVDVQGKYVKSFSVTPGDPYMGGYAFFKIEFNSTISAQGLLLKYKETPDSESPVASLTMSGMNGNIFEGNIFIPAINFYGLGKPTFIDLDKFFWSSPSENIEKNIAAIYPRSFLDSQLTGGVCRELVTGHNNASADRMNLIFIGIDYKDFDTPVNFLTQWSTEVPLTLKQYFQGAITGQGDQYAAENQYAMFRLDPFKTKEAQEKFNFWYFDKPIDSKMAGMSQVQISNFLKNQISIVCGLPNSTSVFIRYGLGGGAYAVFSEHFATLSHYNFRVGNSLNLVHELGHALWNLHDEYVSPQEGNLYNLETIKTRNTFADSVLRQDGDTTLEECKANAQWKDYIGKGCGDPNIIDCVDGYTPPSILWLDSLIQCKQGVEWKSCANEVICFEGGGNTGQVFDVFRSTYDSIMRGGINPSYGPWNVHLIEEIMSGFTGK